MKFKFAFLALFCCTIHYSQNFLEVQLPTPENISSFFIGPLVTSTIHYGATPPNYNGKVILFNHGYIDLNQTQFLFNNSYYQKTYEEGYQSVFVATTRGEGIWVNGKLLAESIDIATEKFNVPSVYIVGHSNGGKAMEAAMIQYDKKDKVQQAFALGTPFWGTYLADISQMPWLNWAWRLTGLNEGALTSTTYYCNNIIRPYLDNHPNNEPEKFVILGASGYYNGSNILAKAAFSVTGGILLPVQGINDGVASYNSTLRPGAEYVFRKNDSRAIFDHLDMSLGQFSWSYVQSYIENTSRKNNNLTKNKSQKNAVIESNYYIIHSDNEYEQISFDKNASYAVAQIIHENPTAAFQVFDKTGKQLKSSKSVITGKHQTIIPFSENNIHLKSDSKFVAFIKHNNGITMSLEQLQRNSYPILKVDISASQKNAQFITNARVNGVIIKTATINGTKLQNDPEVISFEKKDDSFYFDTKHLEPGVYSLFVSSESTTNFKRSIISGFVVGAINNSIINLENENSTNKVAHSIHITPNSVKEYALLSLTGYKVPDQLLMKIYDITGKEIKKITLRGNQNGTYNISESVYSLSKGIYLLKIDNFKTIKFIKE